MTLRAQQPTRVETPDRRTFVVRELDEVGRPRLTIRQRPAQSRVIADARRHLFLADVAYCARHRERCTVQGAVHVQLEVEWIHLQRGLVRAQSESGPGGARGDNVEWPDAGKAMSGKGVDLRADTVTATCQRADYWKQERRATRPDSRVTVPEQLMSARVSQNGELRAEGVHLGAELCGAQWKPGSLQIFHARYTKAWAQLPGRSIAHRPTGRRAC